MTAQINSPGFSLYEKDFYLWLSVTAAQLKENRFNEIDLEHLIEEIEDMGRSTRRALESYLERLLEHLLKLAYWDGERGKNQNHWKTEINNFRREIKRIIKDSPSLAPYTSQFFDSIYGEIATTVKSSFRFDVPSQCPFTLEEVLDSNWFPLNSEQYIDD